MKSIQVPDDIKWIGVKRKEGFPIETSYFKTIFELPSTVEDAVLRISANTRYCLSVNSTEIIHGPCRGDHWHHFCDSVDIASYLKQGKNVVAVKVTAYPSFETTTEDYSNFGPIWAMSPNTGPMLIVWGEFGDGIDISTGRADWHYLNDSAINWHIQRVAHWMGCTEDVEGAKLPWGWQTDMQVSQGFEPAIIKWDNIVKFGEIRPLFLYDRPIKHLLRKEIEGLYVLTHSDNFSFPVKEGHIVLPANDTYEAIIATERLTTSFVYLRCKDGAGSRIKLLYSEAYSKADGDRSYKENRSNITGELIGVEDIYRPGGGDEIYSPSWFRTFRFIKVIIETGDTPLTLYPLKLIETRYPLENKISFTSGQQWAQKIWDISLRTLELCMHETYEDCPFYEQLQYTMDTRLQMLFTYAISNDTDLPMKTIHDYHTSLLPEGILQSRFPSKHPQIIPVFALHWIFMLKDIYMETGDLSILERYRPTMESVLGWFKRKTGAHGLIEHLDYWDYIDWTDAWADIQGTPRASKHGPATIQNLVYAYALGVSSELLDALGHTQLAQKYMSEKVRILENVETLCWSAEKELYSEGPGYEEYSQHAQLWAVLSGLAHGDKAKAIMGKTITDTTLIPCSFVLQFYLFRALELAGMYEETEKLWDMWKELLDLDLTTVPEIPSKYTRSDCHAWGALILHELPRKFLGVTSLEPGYGKIKIQPMGLYMQEISGSVPTPHGMVNIKWSCNDRRFVMEGSTPIPALVVLPNEEKQDVGAGQFAFDIII